MRKLIYSEMKKVKTIDSTVRKRKNDNLRDKKHARFLQETLV